MTISELFFSLVGFWRKEKAHIALFWEASDWYAEQVIVNINTPVMTKKWLSGRNITGKSERGGGVETLKSAEYIGVAGSELADTVGMPRGPQDRNKYQSL